MPWTSEDATKHTKKADTPKKQKTWAKIANARLKACMADGGDQDKCEASAIKVANAMIAKMGEAEMPITDVGQIAKSAIETALAIVKETGEITPKRAETLLYALEADLNEAWQPGAGVRLADAATVEVDGVRVPIPDLVEAYREAEKTGEEKDDWKLTKSDITKLISMIDAELGRRKKKKEGQQEEAAFDVQEMAPVDDDMTLEQLTDALFKSCPSRLGKTFSQWMGAIGNWVKTTATKSLTGYRRRLVMVGTKMGMKFASASEAEFAETDRDKLRGLLQQALEVLGAPGEAAEVELAESASGAAVALVEAEPAADGARAPLLMDVALIRPGWGNKKDNHFYPREMLERDAHVFAGVKMYTTDHKEGEKSERTEVSKVQGIVGFADDGAPIARVAVFDPDFAEKARNRAALDELGSLECSILARGKTKAGEVDGRKGYIVEAITSAQSVDWVTRAGAGGHALNLAESDDGGETMTEQQKAAAPEEEGSVGKQVEETQEQEVHTLSESEVASILSETNLPDAAKEKLAAGKYEDEEQVKEAVVAEKAYLKEVTGSGKPFGQGGGKPPSERISEADVQANLDKIDARYGVQEVVSEHTK